MVPRVDLLKCQSELRAVTEEAQVADPSTKLKIHKVLERASAVGASKPRNLASFILNPEP
jgi:hypothetical protein